MPPVGAFTVILPVERMTDEESSLTPEPSLELPVMVKFPVPFKVAP